MDFLIQNQWWLFTAGVLLLGLLVSLLLSMVRSNQSASRYAVRARKAFAYIAALDWFQLSSRWRITHVRNPPEGD